MRGDYQRERTSVLTWLISAIIAGFVVQLVLGTSATREANDVFRTLALSVPALRAGWIWTLLTHSFLHNPHFIFHVVGNVFALYLLGRELLPMLGARRFLGLYAAATIIGGLAWAAVHWRHAGPDMPSLIGATAAIDALFIVFACFFPDQELNFLFLFLFPVTLKPKHVAVALVAFDLINLVFSEIPNAALPYDVKIASSAHLGGMLTAFVFYRFVYDSPMFSHGRGGEIELPRWLKRAKKPRALPPPPAEQINTPSPEELRAEVDRILDKINSQGFGALTADERRILDEARDQLSRH